MERDSVVALCKKGREMVVYSTSGPKHGWGTGNTLPSFCHQSFFNPNKGFRKTKEQKKEVKAFSFVVQYAPS